MFLILSNFNPPSISIQPLVGVNVALSKLASPKLLCAIPVAFALYQGLHSKFAWDICALVFTPFSMLPSGVSIAVCLGLHM